MTVYLPKPIFQKMCESNSCATMMENKAVEIFTVSNKMYVIIGSISQKIYLKCWAYEVVFASMFKGLPRPYDYGDQKGYKNQYLNCKGKKYVVIGGEQMEFMPTEAGVQTELF